MPALVIPHEPRTCSGAVCPLHGRDHADEGGWLEILTPEHPALSGPRAWLRGRFCATKLEYAAHSRGITVAELRTEIARDHGDPVDRWSAS